MIFFFQAEDGIRVRTVTGVQTCALPIFVSARQTAPGDRGVQGAVMAKPRELKRRIRSVQNTRKITKTMELVSTSKLKRAQDRVIGARPYAQALAEVNGELHSPELAERFPTLRQPGKTGRGAGVRRAALLLITS